MIRLATSSDLTEIKGLTEACAVALQEKKIFQWNENYPSREKLSRDIEKQELFVLEMAGELMGIIVLTKDMDDVYVPVEWLTPKGKSLYVHRLATRPANWGKGYGRQLMDFAEDLAKENDFVSVRLDTFSQNSRNLSFYENRGYTRLGKIYFPKKSEHPFYCYEKIIT